MIKTQEDSSERLPMSTARTVGSVSISFQGISESLQFGGRESHRREQTFVALHEALQNPKADRKPWPPRPFELLETAPALRCRPDFILLCFPAERGRGLPKPEARVWGCLRLWGCGAHGCSGVRLRVARCEPRHEKRASNTSNPDPKTSNNCQPHRSLKRFNSEAAKPKIRSLSPTKAAQTLIVSSLSRRPLLRRSRSLTLDLELPICRWPPRPRRGPGRSWQSGGKKGEHVD